MKVTDLDAASAEDERAIPEAGQRLLRALTAYSATRTELGRAFARSQRMHPTDAAAVVEILTAENRGEPLTPARLASLVGLTTGATSTLLNRLEAAGHVVRSREHRDRRVVTLRSTAAIHAAAVARYRPVAEAVAAVLADCGEQDLDRFALLVEQLTSVTRSPV